MNVRPFAADDFGPVVALMRDTLEMPGLGENLMARDFLLAPGFRPEHLLVAEAGGQIAGFVLAPRHDSLAPPETGWIAAFGVAPSHRRQGIATALLGTVLDKMRAEGIRRIDIADVPVRYLLPGVDRAAFPLAFNLLTRHLGFSLREEVASMGIALNRPFAVPPEIRVAGLGELPLLRDFFHGWEPGWWEHIERSTLLKLAGDPEPSEILAFWENGRPLGVCHFRGQRFGPLAVSEGTRGRGIGAALTLASLARMQASGFTDAYFLVGRAEVQQFYSRLGFSVLRRFAKLSLSL